ncbi:MAG: type II and III secretion system family protein [Pseudomonadota bacterium]
MKKFRKESAIEKNIIRLAFALLPLFLATACAPADIGDGHTANVPAVAQPLGRYEGLNEKRDPVTLVRLGRDVLTPLPMKEDRVPDDTVGPYELRGETLASALQLILDEYDISLAFETDEGLKRRITVSNLHGKLKDVINRVCSLADLYCHFEQGTLTIKNTETFIVDLPPISGGSSGSGDTANSGDAANSDSGSTTDNEAYTQIATGLAAIIGMTPTVDNSTRVMIYTATQRSNKYALQYFERLRKNTALIIFETHVWEVTLNNSNRTGIRWDALFNKVAGGKFDLGVSFPGGAPVGTGQAQAIAITAGAGANTDTQTVLEFISERGAVKTVSQPQITVLSGSTATLNIKQKQNYLSGVTRTPCNNNPPGCTDTFAMTTATVETGLNMNVTSAWDQSTVYGNLMISLDELLGIDTFSPDNGGSSVQLPKTTTRSLQTEIRVRPGDSILIGGLVSEKDNLTDSGPGFMKPLFTTARDVNKINTELVFLLRPRVVAFIQGDDEDTPPIADAPKDGAAKPGKSAPDVSGRINGSSERGKADYPTVLPAGISPEALAPQTLTPPAAPASPGKAQDLPEKGDKGKDDEKPVTLYGGAIQ